MPLKPWMTEALERANKLTADEALDLALKAGLAKKK